MEETRSRLVLDVPKPELPVHQAEMKQTMRKWESCIALATVAFLLSTVAVSAGKMKTEELIALHQKAIGENLVRKNRVAQGSGSVDIRVGGQGNLNGRAMFLAEGDKLRTTLTFGHIQYPQETLIRNGNDLDIAYITPGIRSQLGTAIWDNFPRLAQEGLYAGVLSTDWALLNPKKKQAKIRYRGLKTFEGRRLHEVDYKPKKNVSYRVRLYFEPETYRHVASKYRIFVPRSTMRGLTNILSGGGAPVGASLGITAGSRTVSGARGLLGQIGGPGAGDDPATRSTVELTERFSDFKEVDGLTLPHLYQITLNVDANTGFVGHWEMKLERMVHDQRIAARAFTIQMSKR